MLAQDNYVVNRIIDKSPHSAENIRNATAHWLRHTALSHAAQSEVSSEILTT